jgi:hypothetical protein
MRVCNCEDEMEAARWAAYFLLQYGQGEKCMNMPKIEVEKDDEN